MSGDGTDYGPAKSDCVERCEYPPDGFHECDVPTGFVGQFEVRPELEERYACDVSFVSTASKSPEEVYRERRRQTPPELLPLIDAVYEEVCSYLKSGLQICNPKTFLERMMAETGVEVVDVAARQDLETWYVFRLFDWGFRQEALRWTAAWARRRGGRFRIYGRGWESFAGLEEFAGGHLWEREEVAAVHRFSKISLQLFALTALHQRTYDILGAGGFPLFRRTATDYRCQERAAIKAFLAKHPPGDLLLEEHGQVARWARTHLGPLGRLIERLEQGEDPLGQAHSTDAVTEYPVLGQVTFDSAESLAERLDFYLGNEEARLSKGEELRRAILAQATYQARMDQAIDFVGRRLRLRTKYGCRGQAPRRGPETPSSAGLLVFKTDFGAAPSGAGNPLAQIEERLTRWMAEAVAGCQVVSREKCPWREWEKRAFDLLEEHAPDAAVTFQRPLFRGGAAVSVKQLLVSYSLTGALFDVEHAARIRLAVLANATCPELHNRAACRAWTGLADDRVRGWWMPCEADAADSVSQSEAQEDGDLSVILCRSVRDNQLVEGWRRIILDGKESLGPVLDRLVLKRQQVLEDPSSVTPEGLDAVFDELRTEADAELGSQAGRFLRFTVLPRLVETWHQERWLERLARWAEGQRLSVRIAATEAWQDHPVFGSLVVPLIGGPPTPRCRLHLGFSSAVVPPALDVAAMVAGRPTLLWRSPNWEAGGGSASTSEEGFCPTTRELCPGADGLTFADWDELTERIEAHMADPAALTEQTHAVAEHLAAQLAPARLLRGLLRWALAD